MKEVTLHPARAPPSEIGCTSSIQHTIASIVDAIVARIVLTAAHSTRLDPDAIRGGRWIATRRSPARA